ncbi:hypothetical protein JOS77_24360 [Chromobacterium haemolyticum]|nr:hypothetical protein JOS77_24360 [Chromobacterium haemolyticum]
MGRSIDPTNSLYLSDGEGEDIEAAPAPVSSPGGIDLDKELFGEPEATPPAAAPEPVAAPEAAVPADDPLAALFAEPQPEEAEKPEEANLLNFDLDAELTAPAEPKPEATPAAAAPAENNLLDFDFNLEGMAAETPAAAEAPAASAAPAAASAGFESLYEDRHAGGDAGRRGGSAGGGAGRRHVGAGRSAGHQVGSG